MDEQFLLRALVGLLAVYHLGMGLLATFSSQWVTRVLLTFYAATLPINGPLVYTVKMIGLLALALGYLMVLAACDPLRHREVIVITAALLVARAFTRVSQRALLASEMHIPAWRNGVNVVLLLVIATALLLLLPPAPVGM